MRYQIEFQSTFFPVQKMFNKKTGSLNQPNELYLWAYNQLSTDGWECELRNLPILKSRIAYNSSYVILIGKKATYKVYCGWTPNYNTDDCVHGVWHLQVIKTRSILNILSFERDLINKDKLANYFVGVLAKNGCINIRVIDSKAMKERFKKIKTQSK